MNNHSRKWAFSVCIMMGIMFGLSTGTMIGMLDAIGTLFAGISAGLFIRPVLDATDAENDGEKLV